MLKIPPRHNSKVTIMFRGHNLQDQVAYFISNHHTKKAIDPNINILNSIYNMKGKSTLYIMVDNYTNKHITLTKDNALDIWNPQLTGCLKHL